MGILDSRGSPYIIRVDLDIGHCVIVLPVHTFPLSKGSYCVKKPNGGGDDNFVVDFDYAEEDHTIKYDFVSPKG
jgi:hypothetical protein